MRREVTRDEVFAETWESDDASRGISAALRHFDGCGLSFVSDLPAAAKTWMILPLGAAAFVTFYLVFRVMITRLNLKTPGREDEPSETAGTASLRSTDVSGSGAVPDEKGQNTASLSEQAVGTETASSEEKSGTSPESTGEPMIVDGFNVDGLLRGLGGKENIQSLDNCITRLRVDVKDYELVDSAVLKAAGAKAVIKTGPESLQVVIGMKVQGVADAMRKRAAACHPMEKR